MTFLNRCVVCGKKTYKENLCLEHYFSFKLKNILTNKLKNIKIKFCPICGRFFYKNKSYYNPNTLFRSISKKILDIADLNFNIALNEEDKSIDIIVEPNKLNYVIKVPIIFEICRDCSIAKSSYFNLVFQIRGSDKFINIAYNDVKLYINKYDLIIIKEEWVKNGVDFYIYNSKINISKIISYFSSKYNIKRSEEVVSLDRRTSKVKKRITILIKE